MVLLLDIVWADPQSTDSPGKYVCRQTQHVHVRAVSVKHSQHTQTLLGLLARLLGLRGFCDSV